MDIDIDTNLEQVEADFELPDVDPVARSPTSSQPSLLPSPQRWEHSRRTTLLSRRQIILWSPGVAAIK